MRGSGYLFTKWYRAYYEIKTIAIPIFIRPAIVFKNAVYNY